MSIWLPLGFNNFCTHSETKSPVLKCLVGSTDVELCIFIP